MEGLLCFCGCDVSDGAEQAAIVVTVDPAESFPLDVAHGLPRSEAVDDLCLELAIHLVVREGLRRIRVGGGNFLAANDT